ncbi:MAG: proliferating cell nuclear antigen (pcna) [Candidatus Micrarchaeota archaeon]
MELIIADAREFKSAVDGIVNLIDEGTFEISEEGLKLRAMDPSQIALVDFSLPKSAFKKISLDSNISITLNLVDFAKVLASGKAGDELTISLDEKANKLHLEFKGESKKKFKLPLLETNATQAREPKIEFDALIKMRGGSLKGMLRDAGLFSSHVVIQADETEFVVEANGDSGDLHIQTTKESGAIAEISTKNKSRVMFPFEYLEDITKACADDALMEINLKTDAPIKITYPVCRATLTYFLAPRVENV